MIPFNLKTAVLFLSAYTTARNWSSKRAVLILIALSVLSVVSYNPIIAGLYVLYVLYLNKLKEYL